ncbi:MAG: DinB family protein [Cyclobacteriaceae bacterium]
MKRIELLNSLEQDVQRLLDVVEKEFSILPVEVLYSKPGKDSWSALECLEHINIANGHYLKQFESMMADVATSPDVDDFQSGFLGNYFVKMMVPRKDRSIPSPMKTFKKFLPSMETDISVLDVFIADQKQLLQVLKECEKLDLNRIKITSAIGSILRFRLGDALRFIIGHADRHIIQAKKAIELAKSVSPDSAVRSGTLV